jgi:hypothetical protein
MSTLAISIDIPSAGQQETTGSASSPSLLVTVGGFSYHLQDGQAVAPPSPAAPPKSPAAAAVPRHAPGLSSIRTWALSTGERAFFTFTASFLSALVLSGTFSIPVVDAALFAAASAALSVVTAAIRSLTPPTDDKALDIVTRVGLTLLQAFTAAFVTSTAGATHFGDWRAGALAGLAAAFTAFKGTLAVQLTSERATPASLIPIRASASASTGTGAAGTPALSPAGS